MGAQSPRERPGEGGGCWQGGGCRTQKPVKEMGGTGSQWLVGVTGVRQRGPLRRLLAELGWRAETDPAQCLGGRRWGRARVERGKVPVLSLGRGPVSRGPMGPGMGSAPCPGAAGKVGTRLGPRGRAVAQRGAAKATRPPEGSTLPPNP